MAHELIFTSTKSPSKSGDQTVAMTANLPFQVKFCLENISSYVPMYQLSDSRAEANPVNYAHTIFNNGKAEPLHTLSRIGFAGSDHTGRSNFIAHHYCLGAEEQSDLVYGPAWTIGYLRRLDRFKISWPRSMDTDVQEVHETSCILPQDRASNLSLPWVWPSPGMAGMAGRLADAFCRKEYVYVIYPPAFDILPLFLEAIELLPIEERWQVTFTTYGYNRNIPLAASYNWIGMPVDADTTQLTNPKNNELVLDLRNLTIKPEHRDGKYFHFALQCKGDVIHLVDNLEQRLDAQAKDNNRLQTDKHNLEVQIAGLKEDISRLNNRSNALASDNQSLRSQLQGINAVHNKELQDKQAEFETENERERALTHHWFSEFEKKKTDLEHLEKTRDFAYAERDKLLRKQTRQRLVNALIGLAGLVVGLVVGYLCFRYLK